MNIIEAIILGLIQGLTEFIPISSSGHLVLMHHVFGVVDSGMAFDVALHLGTLIALIGYFWKDLWSCAKSLFKKSDNTKLVHLLILATIPAAAFGYFMEERAATQFRSVRLVGVTMLLFGFIMLAAEHFYRKQQKHAKLEDITALQAMAMGFAQAVAIIPGVSRSGSTITAGLFTGLERVAATRFSFLLGIPITAGAILKVFTSGGVLQSARDQQTIFLIGIVTALISGLFAIKFMLSFLSKHGLHAFAYYRIALGIIILLIFTIKA